MRYVLFLAVAAFTVFAAADCGQSTVTQRAGVPRWLWLVLIIIVPVLGPALWLLVSRNARGQNPGHGAGEEHRGGSAPDDDPEFLHRLGDDN